MQAVLAVLGCAMRHLADSPVCPSHFSPLPHIPKFAAIAPLWCPDICLPTCLPVQLIHPDGSVTDFYQALDAQYDAVYDAITPFQYVRCLPYQVGAVSLGNDTRSVGSVGNRHDPRALCPVHGQHWSKQRATKLNLNKTESLGQSPSSREGKKERLCPSGAWSLDQCTVVSSCYTLKACCFTIATYLPATYLPPILPPTRHLPATYPASSQDINNEVSIFRDRVSYSTVNSSSPAANSSSPTVPSSSPAAGRRLFEGIDVDQPLRTLNAAVEEQPKTFVAPIEKFGVPLPAGEWDLEGYVYYAESNLWA